MGLISLTWVFCHDLVKIHLKVIQILSFSCSVLLLVKADGNHLAVPNCKNNNKKKNQNPLLRYCHFLVKANCGHLEMPNCKQEGHDGPGLLT